MGWPVLTEFLYNLPSSESNPIFEGVLLKLKVFPFVKSKLNKGNINVPLLPTESKKLSKIFIGVFIEKFWSMSN